MEFYASCPEGFESALADELKRLGLSHVRRLKGRATFEGELEEGYRACLWSRLASRVFVVLGRFEAQDADGQWHKAIVWSSSAWKDVKRQGCVLTLACPEAKEIKNVRYCYKNFIIGKLHNSRGLPVVPFSSEK